MINKELELVSGPPGSYKTTSLIKQKFQKYNTCYVVPSLHLCDQYFDNIKQYHNTNIKLINHKQTKKVVEEVYTHMKQSEESFIITFQAYIRTRNNWFEDFGFNIVHDEPENYLLDKTLRFSTDHHPQDYFNINEETLNITLTDACDEYDEFPNNEFKEFVHLLSSGRMIAFLYDCDSLKRKENEDGKEYFQLEVALLPTVNFYPEVSVKLVGHRVSNNYYVKMYSDQKNITYEDSTKNIKDIATKQITIYYFDINTNTKHRKYTNPEVYQKRIEYCSNNVKGSTGILRNKYDQWDYQDEAWIDLPANTHGRNDLMYLDNIIITLTAHMKTKFHNAVKKYSNGKITDDDIFFFRNGGLYFQTVMRSKIRDKNTNDSADIYTMDYKSADYIKKELESAYGYNVTLKKIDGYESIDKSENKKPKKWKNQSENNKASKMVKLARDNYYSSNVNNLILKYVENNTREKIKTLPIWNKVNTRGLYKKGENV